MQGWSVGDGRDVTTLLSLTITEPDDEAEHQHDEQQQ